MSYPKLLQEIVTAEDLFFAFNFSGPQNVTVPAGTYSSILELCACLEVQLQAVLDTFSVVVSTHGIVTISAKSDWTVTWAGTDDELSNLLGFRKIEIVADMALVGSRRHRYGWYAPGGVAYPGRQRRIARFYRPTDSGGASVFAGSGTQTTITFFFDALLEAQVEPVAAGVADDGYGSSVDWTGVTYFDWWIDTAGKKWRYYEDADDGTVAAPGTEGTEYHTCVRTDDEAMPEQLDPDSYTYFRVSLPAQIVGS